MDMVPSVLRVDGLAYKGSGPMNNPPDHNTKCSLMKYTYSQL